MKRRDSQERKEESQELLAERVSLERAQPGLVEAYAKFLVSFSKYEKSRLAVSRRSKSGEPTAAAKFR